MSADAPRSILLVIMVALLLSIGIWATQAAVDEQATEFSVGNEQHDRTDGFSELEADGDRYYNETIRFASDGSELDEDEYIWRADEGKVAWNTTDGQTMEIDYTYSEVPEQTSSFVDVFEPLWRMGGWLILVVVVGAMFAGFRYLESQAKRGSGGAY